VSEEGVINLGIIGYGKIGRIHKKNFEVDERVRISAIADPSINQFDLDGIPCFDDYDQSSHSQ
jgi:glyceraldehyde-3-phosphate dehydrogenase/erythrose-4-phosphate dehydrogenase